MSSLNPSPVNSSATTPHGGNAPAHTPVKQAGGGDGEEITPKVSGGKKGRKSRKFFTRMYKRI